LNLQFQMVLKFPNIPILAWFPIWLALLHFSLLTKSITLHYICLSHLSLNMVDLQHAEIWKSEDNNLLVSLTWRMSQGMDGSQKHFGPTGKRQHLLGTKKKNNNPCFQMLRRPGWKFIVLNMIGKHVAL
jgi:hypothetical protein